MRIKIMSIVNHLGSVPQAENVYGGKLIESMDIVDVGTRRDKQDLKQVLVEVLCQMLCEGAKMAKSSKNAGRGDES